jgi:hypothetical protein
MLLGPGPRFGAFRRGIPQGSPISPLLANLYMRRFVLGWKMLGLERSLGTRIVTYADDDINEAPIPSSAREIALPERATLQFA